jgi:hypothetical protein
MGVRQRGVVSTTSAIGTKAISTEVTGAKIIRPRHPSRRVGAASAAALRRGLGSPPIGALSAWFAPPLTPLTASRAPSHATSVAS